MNIKELVKAKIFNIIANNGDKYLNLMRFVNAYEDERCAIECESIIDLESEDDVKCLLDGYGVKVLKTCLNSGNRFFIVGCNFDDPKPIDCDGIKRMALDIADDYIDRMKENRSWSALDQVVEIDTSLYYPITSEIISLLLM